MSTQHIVDERQKIGGRLREAREKHGLSQYRLGKKAGVLSRSINYWEKGRGEPSITAALKLAAAMELTVDELFG